MSIDWNLRDWVPFFVYLLKNGSIIMKVDFYPIVVIKLVQMRCIASLQAPPPPKKGDSQYKMGIDYCFVFALGIEGKILFAALPPIP